MNTINTIINANDAASLLGIKPGTLRQWRSRGKPLPQVRISQRAIAYPLLPLICFGIQRHLRQLERKQTP